MKTSQHIPESTGQITSNDWIKFIFWQDCKHEWYVRFEYGRNGEMRIFRQLQITWIMKAIIEDISGK